jgi:hypothetical protein
LLSFESEEKIVSLDAESDSHLINMSSRKNSCHGRFLTVFSIRAFKYSLVKKLFGKKSVYVGHGNENFVVSTLVAMVFRRKLLYPRKIEYVVSARLSPP